MLGRQYQLNQLNLLIPSTRSSKSCINCCGSRDLAKGAGLRKERLCAKEFNLDICRRHIHIWLQVDTHRLRRLIFLRGPGFKLTQPVQNRLVEEHQRSEALRGDGIVLLLPDTVCSFHSTDGGDFFLQGLKAESPSRTSKYPSSCFWIIIRFLTGLGKSVH